jgi:hypothetical protein
VWVVRSTIYLRTFDDWNRSSAGVAPEPEVEVEAVSV